MTKEDDTLNDIIHQAPEEAQVANKDILVQTIHLQNHSEDLQKMFVEHTEKFARLELGHQSPSSRDDMVSGSDVVLQSLGALEH